VVASEDLATTAIALAAKLKRKLATAELATAVFGVPVTQPPTVSLSSLPPSAPLSGPTLREDSSAVSTTENELSGGAIAGIVVGCLVVMAALGTGAAVLLWRRSRLQQPHQAPKVEV